MERTDPEKPTISHERRDVPVKAIAQFLAWLLVSAVVISLAMWGLFKFFEARQKRSDVSPSPLVAASLKRTPPAPRLETQPLALRTKLRAEEEARLNSFSWADRTGGVVRIPIERAMDLVAQRGVPGGSTSMAPTPTPSPQSVGEGLALSRGRPQGPPLRNPSGRASDKERTP